MVTLLFTRPLLITPVQAATIPTAYKDLVPELTKPAPNFEKEVLEPLKKIQAEKAEAERIAQEAEARRLADLEAARIASQARVVTYTAPVVYRAPVASPASWEGLMGTMGYSRAGGNCVNEPGINNPRNGTNPGSWPATSRSPWIGATALFYFNHAAVVTGIWSNGDIEVRHQNAGGAPHRFSPGQIRGYR